LSNRNLTKLKTGGFNMNKIIIFVAFLLLFVGCGKLNDTPDNKVVDIDNNVYSTQTFGTQTWMLEDLKTTRYNDGTLIPESFMSIENSDNIKYTYYTVTDNICPTGWHIPYEWEWKVLIDYFEKANLPMSIGNTGGIDGICPTFWWSATSYNSVDAWSFYTCTNNTNCTIYSVLFSKERYLNVRCVKD
jgi:hypothetical protein